MTTINTALAFDSNDKARLKLRVLELYETSGFRAVEIAFPGVSRRSVCRWKKRYLSSQKKLSSLIPRSTRPKRVRQMVIPQGVLGFVKVLREKYPKLSKYKIKVFLDIFCEERGLPLYSPSWIGKLISRHKLFFEVRKPVRRKRRSLKGKNRIKYCPKQRDVTLGYLQLDGVRVDFEGRSYYFLCAVELKTRQSFVRRVKTLSSYQAKLFIEDIISLVGYSIHTIQTDNGSEFHALFNQALKELRVKHLWSYPRKPKTQGYVERFNRTVQEEFINYQIDEVTINLDLFDQKLAEWNTYYNQTRPHQSLGYLTPNQYLLQLMKGGA